MMRGARRIFRPSATERITASEQLDQLIVMARPLDWLATIIILVAITVLIGWGVLGRIPTQVVGEGILIVNDGRIEGATPAQGPLVAVIYVDADKGKAVRPGMRTRIELAPFRREEYGFLLGKVVATADFPAATASVSALIHNDDLARRFAGEPAYATVLELEGDAAAVSNYRWSVGSGPPVPVSAGTLIRATVTLSEQRPIDLVLPLLRGALGTG
jgi:HlyD family secretion protein